MQQKLVLFKKGERGEGEAKGGSIKNGRATYWELNNTAPAVVVWLGSCLLSLSSATPHHRLSAVG